MNNKFNLSQLAELLAQAGGMSKSASEQFIKNFFDLISQSVLSEGLVKVKGLGTFKLLQIEERESVNVNTGERFTIEGHQKIAFVPDPDLKEFINRPFASFECVELTPEQALELSKGENASEQPANTESSVDDANYADDEPEEQLQEQSQAEEEQPQVAESEQSQTNGKGVDETLQPVVKEVTQKRGLRILLRTAVWILSIVLVLSVALYVCWPFIGIRTLDHIEQKLYANNDKPQNESGVVVTSTNQVQNTVQEQVDTIAKPKAVVDEQAKPDVRTAEPVTLQSSVQPTKPAATKPAATKPATTKQTKYSAVQLNSADMAKELSQFTIADTVNFVIEGLLVECVLSKDETITKLALEYYGSKKLWPYIVKYNQIENPAKLRPGTKIRIPVLKAR